MPKVEILQRSFGSSVVFHCPGCNSEHSVNVRNDGNHPSWSFDGDIDRPTIAPSILVRSTELTDKGREEYQQWCDSGYRSPAPDPLDHIDTACHSYVTDGRIQFLSDSTYYLAGQTMDLPEVD